MERISRYTLSFSIVRLQCHRLVMNCCRSWLCFLALLLSWSPASADWSNGRALYLNGPPGLNLACKDCHGSPPQFFGIGLAANNPSLIAFQIQNYLPMKPFSGLLSNADLVDIAAYIASPSADPGAPPPTPAAPSCSLGASQTSIAAGGIVTLTATCSPAASAYAWSANTGFGSTVSAGTVAPSLTTTYSVTGSNAGGTGNSASVTVTVTAAPLSTPACMLMASPESITAGGTSTLTASCSPTALSYTWTGSGCAGINSPSCAVAPASSTAYTVTGSNAAGSGAPASATVTVSALTTTPSPYTGLWWNANESGWGMSITQHGNINFVAAYTYDQAGLPAWYVMSNCPVSGNSCTGALYRVSGGTPPTAPWNGSGKVVSQVGSATLSFANADNASFSFSIDGIAGSKSITRQIFATGGTPAVDYSDLWWNPDESGWGVALTQQVNTIFATWYAYDATGRAIWYVASDCAIVGSGCSGVLYRVSGGSPLTAPWNGANRVVTAVGTLSINFSDASNGTLNYVIGGVGASRSITRQAF